MKKLIATTLASVVALGAFAQGQISFKNLNSSPAINAKVFLSDGTTTLSGSQYMAGLFAGTTAANMTQVAGVAIPFLTGGAAGYFSGGTVTLPGIPGGAPAFFEVVAWNTAAGATFAAAKLNNGPNSWGQSSVFSITPGDPNGTPPGTPAFLVGLTSFNLVGVPEPSSLALAGLGAAALLIFRRRK